MVASRVMLVCSPSCRPTAMPSAENRPTLQLSLLLLYGMARPIAVPLAGMFVCRSHGPPTVCALKLTGANASAAALVTLACAAHRKSKLDCPALYGVTTVIPLTLTRTLANWPLVTPPLPIFVLLDGGAITDCCPKVPLGWLVANTPDTR